MSENEIDNTTTKLPFKQLVDIKIECEIPSYLVRWTMKPDEKQRVLERWVREFHEFIRDHRSQDPVNLSVESVYETVCPECEEKWEPCYEDGKTYCANCGVELVKAEVVGQP